jgi:hypothetical protein
MKTIEHVIIELYCRRDAYATAARNTSTLQPWREHARVLQQELDALIEFVETPPAPVVHHQNGASSKTWCGRSLSDSGIVFSDRLSDNEVTCESCLKARHAARRR